MEDKAATTHEKVKTAEPISAPAAKKTAEPAPPPDKVHAAAAPAPLSRGDVEKQMEEQHAKLDRMKAAVEKEHAALDRLIALHNSLPKS